MLDRKLAPQGLILMLALASLWLPVQAQTLARAAYPDRPITLVVPFAAGGPTDKVARSLGQALSRQLNKGLDAADGHTTVVIENIGGGGGTLGAAKVAKASPDGYTILLHHIGMATSPALYRKLPFKPLEDFEYLGMINEVPMTLIGRRGLPAQNFAELRTWVQANKGKINLANAGLGAASHLCGLLFQQALGVVMNTVPFKGTAPAMSELLGGEVDLLCDQTTNTTGQIQSGRVKAFAVTSSAPLRTSALTRLPTMESLGFKGFNVSIWHGLYAPRGTPAATMATLNAALRSALLDPALVLEQESLGAVIITDDRLEPAAHRRFVAAEIVKWGQVIQAAGQYAD